MIRFYRLLMSFVYVLLYPYARFTGGSRRSERLGIVRNAKPVDLWLHAASVGETKVMSYLCDYLLKHKPDLTIHLTVVTLAGLQAAEKLFPEDVTRSLFPLDTPVAMRRILATLRPKTIVIAETEIWPSLITEAKRHGVPLVLVNGRMSEAAAGRYYRIRRSLSRLLAAYDHFFYKTEEDSRRFSAFDIPKDRQTVAGDMKFDAPLPERSEALKAELRQKFSLGEKDFVLVAGSTRPGEEQLLLECYKRIVRNHPRLKLVLAPRHLSRLDEVRSLLGQSGFSYGEITATSPAGAEILVVDRMGILNDLYRAADAAFVGGTLVDFGGHNLLEPVWAGVPCFYGPYLANVMEAAGYIESNNYGCRCESADDFAARLETLIEGKSCFNVKTKDDIEHSPTALAGNYILRNLSDS